jgi:hypothetical protein
MRNANIHDIGQYYIAFFQLSIGIERLTKVIVIVDHAARHDLQFPESKLLCSLATLAFEYQTTQQKETQHRAGLSFSFQNPGTSKILSLQISFRVLFSVKSSWAPRCTIHGGYSDGNAVRPSRDCDVGQMSDGFQD